MYRFGCNKYFDCIENAEVWLYEVVGGGHDWPGSNGNMDINASEEIWSFFSQYTSMLGDINGDQLINILDVILLVSVILDGEYIQSGDLNSDGSVDVLDIVSIVNIILGEDNE